MSLDEALMRHALALAEEAAQNGEVPVGAVVVVGGEIVATGANARESAKDPTAHAELLAMVRAARALDRWRLHDATVYVTLEPCPMCAGALVNARVQKLVFGALDPKAGAVRSLYSLCDDPRLNHRMVIEGGLLAEESGQLLKKFFSERRKKNDR